MNIVMLTAPDKYFSMTFLSGWVLHGTLLHSVGFLPLLSLKMHHGF